MTTSVRRHLHGLLAMGLLTALLLGGVPVTPADAATSTRSIELDFLALVNIERAKAGLGALTERTDIRTVARGHSSVMAREWRLHHNPDYSTQITGWQRISENVGYGPSVDSIHRALLNSEGHRRNIMDDRVTEVGIGVVVTDSRVWVTQNFRRPAGTVTSNPPSTTRFGDVGAGSTHATSIEQVSALRIAEACGIARFCPHQPVTRGQFATMLTRTLDLDRPAAGTSRFSDVSGEQGRDIEALAAAGLTNGCGASSFCPRDELSREQMASFLARALRLESVASSFADMSRTHDGAVGALQRAGIVNGCSADSFCPRDQVTRAQTASMLHRNLG